MSRAGRTYPIRFTGLVLTRGGRTSRPFAVDLRRGDRVHSLVPD